jgi:uncharacterized protein YciI
LVSFGRNSLRWPWSLGRCEGRRQNLPMPWFIKTETIRVPHAEVVPHLQAHRAWVEQLRREGVRISSGYLVDGDGRPGGGGLLLLEASDHAAAEALIRQDPMLTSGSVDWSLQQWIGAVGDLGVG